MRSWRELSSQFSSAVEEELWLEKLDRGEGGDVEEGGERVGRGGGSGGGMSSKGLR